MSILDSIKTYASAEAKSVGSEVVSPTHLLIGISNFLSKRDAIEHDHPIIVIAKGLHGEELAKGLDGYKTPEFSNEVLDMIKDINTLEELQNLGEMLSKKIAKLDGHIPKKNNQKEKTNQKKSIAVGGFHEINGPSLGRLSKYMPNKDDAAVVINAYLVAGEDYLWDGVYNTKDQQLSTRRSTQSMGRVFVTTSRLIFWSDDEDKPQVGVFYSDIESWKSSWMPLKSRGVVMYVGGRKVIFAANSTAMEYATKEIETSR
jgi:hypothetical protein